MAEFYLVRHGQASFGSDNYDQLSPMGYQQASWLGEHFKQQGTQFDRVVTGTMLRHDQTAKNICAGLQLDTAFETHAGLNEYDFYALVKNYLQMFPEQQPKKGEKHSAFYKVLKKAITMWANAELEGDLPETFAQFKNRVGDALAFVQDTSAKRTLVVTSGGPIGMAMCHVLQLNNEKMIQLNLQIKNTSYSQFFFNQQGASLASFNNTAHLEKEDREGGLTYG